MLVHDGYEYIHRVLIESDWNLKITQRYADILGGKSINRIRLEFKDRNIDAVRYENASINRIRLEFKEANEVDDEISQDCINRIRLEFKGSFNYSSW